MTEYVVYISNDYEWTSSGVTQYYSSGSQRVGMRRSGYAANNGLFWIIADHLGSTSITASANGSFFSEQRYTAWGTNRYTSGSLLSQRQYTGQINDGFGLYFYNARFYDPYLNRWTQPDTIIPEEVQGVQAWDRYAYTNNNSVLYTDPTGHCVGPLLLVCIGVALIGAGASVSAINSGVEQVEWASSQTETIAQEQVAAQQWQDNCMGQCHYSNFVNPTPGVTVGGQRPDTPVSDTLALGYYNIAQGTAGLVGSTVVAGALIKNGLSVNTPYGRAWQRLTPDALRLRSQVSNGAELYRGGVLGQTNVAEGQFWAPENPLLPGYADHYGVGSYSGLPDFIVGGSMKPGEQFITRYSPGVGSNVGGAMEVVTFPNAIHLNYIIMR